MNSSFIKHLPRLAAGIALATACGVAAAVTQLGFALDESGSVSTANYNLQKNGLAAALGAVPTDGTVEVTVVSFASGVQVLVQPIVINSQADLTAVQMAVQASSNSGGVTNTSAAIGSLSYLMTNSGNFDSANDVMINISTDGQPTANAYCLLPSGAAIVTGNGNCANQGGTQVNPPGGDQAGAVASAAVAFNAGVDSISIEAIGNFNQGDLNNMLAIAGPNAVQLASNATDIPYPIGSSFVVPVTSFDAYAQVIDAKVRTVVVPPSDVPVPGGLALMGLGLAVLGWAGKRRS